MDFSSLNDYLDSLDVDFGLPGCDCSVYLGHREVYRHQAGYKDLETKVKASDDDLYLIYSATKVATCTGILQLVEAGKLSLDEPVTKYFPEFGSQGVKQGEKVVPYSSVTQATIEDLMTMSGGLNYNMSPPDGAFPKAKGTVAIIREFLQFAPLDFAPREHFQYSLCHDVLGGIIELVSGQKYSDYIRSHITEPLGMKDFYMSPEPEIQGRISTLYNFTSGWYNTEKRSVFVPIDTQTFRNSAEAVYESGGGGAITRVSDYVLLADALANSGEGAKGVRILKSETVENMRKNRLEGQRLDDFHKMGMEGYGYGLGVRTLIDTETSKRPLGEFGWNGAAGAYFLADPSKGLAVFYAQHTLNFGDVFSKIHPEIRDRVYAAL
jgi:CubicO group peptidase (beta-lactamase class C family)